MGFTVTTEPSDNHASVIIRIESDDGAPIGLVEAIKVLAHWMKVMIEDNNIDFSEVAIKSTDKVTKEQIQ